MMRCRQHALLGIAGLLMGLVASRTEAAVSFRAPVTFDVAGAFTLSVGDIDRDGKQDIITSGGQVIALGNLSILYGRGDGTFDPPVHFNLGGALSRPVAADVSGDGLPDLVVCQPALDKILVLVNRGGRAFALPVSYPVSGSPVGIAPADYNGDGKMDLAISDYSAGNVAMLLNRGDGTLSSAVYYGGGSGGPGNLINPDVNGDGRLDVVVANSLGGNVTVFLGDGTGRLRPDASYPAGSSAGEVAAEDYDGDGKVDLATTDWWGGTSGILFGDGTGKFRAPVLYGAAGYPGGLVTADVSGDGAPDLIYGSGGTTIFSVLENTGTGNFLPAVLFTSGGADCRQAVVGDFNDDGRPDVVVGNSSSDSVSVFINDTPRPVPALRAIALDPGAISGGCGTASGVVTLTAPAPAGGAVVTLSSTNTALTFPASVTIPAGQSSAGFTAVSTPVKLLQPGTLIATYNGTGKRIAFTVRPIGIARLSLATNSLPGGQSATGVVTLECAAPSPAGLLVTLASNLPATVPPTTLLVPPGVSSTTFSIPTEFVTLPRTITITASAGGQTQSATLVVLPDPPSAAPANLLATASAPTQVLLTWSDNSRNETSFEIERKSGTAAFLRIATVAANTTAFTDDFRTPNTRYTYRVRAVNASGASGYSNEVSLTMPKVPARVTVFRPATREWFLRNDDATATVIPFGGPGDLPVPADYLGTGSAQVAVFRPVTREWFIRSDTGGTLVLPSPGPGDVPVPADYLGLGHAQVAVFQPAMGYWFIRDDAGRYTLAQFGTVGDVPVPADYLGLGYTQIAVYRPATTEWFVRVDDLRATVVQWGTRGDVPVAADYFGLGRAQIAIYRPSTAEFFLRDERGQATRIPWGAPGDVPVPAEYEGFGRARIAVYRPGSGEWFLRQDDGTATRIPWGGPGDVPVPVSFLAPRAAATEQR